MHRVITVFVHVMRPWLILLTFFVPILCTFPFAITSLKINISAEIQVTHFRLITSFFLQILFVIPVSYLIVQKIVTFFYRSDKKNVSIGNQNNFSMHKYTNFNFAFHCVLLKIKDAKYFYPKPYLRNDSMNFCLIIIVDNITIEF